MLPKQLSKIAIGLMMSLLFSATPEVSAQQKILRLATTTSTENSGLLDTILPVFEHQTGHRVHVIAVGTGKALKYGREGDVDCVLVHAKDAEEEFVLSGHGIERTNVMYNDFVVVGPSDDPAGLANANSVSDAMKRIARYGRTVAQSNRQREVAFVSRGDESGTHIKETSLWPDVLPGEGVSWYYESGQGMANVLLMASQLHAYTITDRGTYIALQERLESVLLYSGDPGLHNPYSLIMVNPELHPHVNDSGARAFRSWLISEEGRRLIRDFRRNGEQLFYTGQTEY